MAQQFDLGSILSAISSQIGVIGNDATSVQAKQAQSEILRTQSIEALGTIGELNQELGAIDASQQMEMESRKKAVASTFGVDMLDPDNRLAVLAREQIAAQDEALSRSKRASELVDMNIFDSPLEYMVARPFAGVHAAQAQAANQRAQMLDKYIMDTNQQAQSTVVTQKAINTELSLDEVEKRAQLTKLNAEEIIRVAQMGKNKADIDDLKVLRGMGEEQVKLAAEGYRLKRHEEEFQMRREEARAAREARAAAKKGAEDDAEYALMRYNIGASIINRPQIPDVESFKSYVKLNKDSKHISAMIDLGNSVEVDPVNGLKVLTPVQIGATPGRAQFNLEYLRGSLNPTQERVSALLGTVSNSAKDKVKSESNGKIDPDSLIREIDATLKGRTVTDKKGKETSVPGMISMMQGNAEQDVGKLRNIYQAPSVQVMEQRLATYAATSPAWKEIVPAAIEAEKSMAPTVDAMLRQGKLAVREGKLKPEQVAEFISTYYTEVTRANNQNEGYMSVGLPPQRNYPVQVTSYSKWTGKSIVGIDATNTAQVKHLIMKDAAVTPKSVGGGFGQGNLFGFN